MHKISLIIATKDRPDELRRALKSVETQTLLPDEVIIVNGGSEPLEEIIPEFKQINIVLLSCRPPSASRQRNLGIRAVGQDMTLVGFLDDDIELEADAIERMMKYWGRCDPSVGGAAFNMANHPGLFAGHIKSMKFIEDWGFYSRQAGLVSDSGFQTMIGFVQKTTRVQWLPTGAVVYRKEIIQDYSFDEWFSDYSYLEDLDFSYRVGKKYHLEVVADAHYYHFPGKEGRGNGRVFGRREILNRLYFVRKNDDLSIYRCYIGLVLRASISLFFALRSINSYNFSRVFGNSSALIESLFKIKADVK